MSNQFQRRNGRQWEMRVLKTINFRAPGAGVSRGIENFRATLLMARALAGINVARKNIQYPGHLLPPRLRKRALARTHEHISLSSTSAHIKANRGGGAVVWSADAGSPRTPPISCSCWHVSVWMLWMERGQGARPERTTRLRNSAPVQPPTNKCIPRSHMRLAPSLCLDRYSPDVYLYIAASHAAT